MHLSFKTRLALWHAIGVAVILAVAALVSNWALSRLVRQQVDRELITLARSEATAVERATDRALRVHEAAPATARPSFERLDKFVQITSLDGTPVARSGTLGIAQLPLSAYARGRLARGQTAYEFVENFGEEPIRVVSVPIEVGSTRYAVQVAASVGDARTVLHAARWLFLLIAIAILTAVIGTGTILSQRAVAPIARIVAQARRIGDANLGARLPHPETQDEIGRLVDTLNDMLARIERGFDLQRHFTADASHELMSPLSRLRTELEVTLRRRRDTAEYEDALRSCLDEVEHLSRVTEELLDLARLDVGGARPTESAPTPVVPIVEETIRRLEDEAVRRGVTVVCQHAEKVSVKVSPGVVGVAVSNVLDNAVKFCDAGGRVTVTVGADGAMVVVAVSDTGPGVQPDELPLIFERFHRGHASRASATAGVGLGLAICRALIERHGGQMSVRSAPGRGSTFEIRLPAAA